MNQNSTTGVITASQPYVKRTPWYTDTDFNVKQTYRVGESKTLAFDATFTNLLNQHAVVSYGQQIDSNYATNFIAPNGQWIINGASFYAAAEHPYDYVTEMNQSFSNGGNPLTVNSEYGKPYLYQVARNIRLGMHFTF